VKEVTVYRLRDHSANIDQLPLKRDWMDLTFDRHAYHCFPVSLANRLGWSISFPEEISFIWDGINDSTGDHIKILSGEKYVHSGRGNRAISFNTGLYFSSRKNISLLTMPVPNQFIEGTQCFTTLLSTSVLTNDIPIAWIVNTANKVITIPANTPIAAIIPISLNEIQSYKLKVKSGVPDIWRDPDWNDKMQARSQASMAKNSVGDWTHFYRDAVDHEGLPIGEHEAKKIILDISKADHEENS
jgi:hypothetical protein